MSRRFTGAFSSGSDADRFITNLRTWIIVVCQNLVTFPPDPLSLIIPRSSAGANYGDAGAAFQKKFNKVRVEFLSHA
jgi:hypothetical protein